MTEMSRDQFPIGMRVLAVDDDPICLKLLESLLIKCQYHVTTTNQAIVALKMLRENKDQFDLVISDVHMPDMDGFKLLELVGLEMDLPVIMLSANGETQAVMKGISHGAVDYLLKPVRLEELKNIWQHVIRRKKFDSRDKENLDSGDDIDTAHPAKLECGQSSTGSGSCDRNGKFGKKRKDTNEEGGEDEENEAENEDPSAQKKPRVVWSIELHRKFVSAVNSIGIDKAVPKRILDMMNVEGLTRENVASHLQKYRLYLKRLSAVANQQANMVAALRSRDTSSYLPMGSSNFNSLVGTRPPPGRTSFQTNTTLPRMNNPTGFGVHGFTPSGSGQLGRMLNTSNPINDLGKHQGTLLLEQPAIVQESNNRLLGGFSGGGGPIGHPNNSFACVAKTTPLLQPSHHQRHSGGFSNQSSDPFGIGIGNSSDFADLGRCNPAWQGATTSTKFSFRHGDLSSSNIRGSTIPPPTASQMGHTARAVTSSNVLMAPLIDPVIQNDASSLLVTTGANVDANLLNFGSSGNSTLGWQEPKQLSVPNPNLAYSSLLSISLPTNIGVNNRFNGNQALENGGSSRNVDVPMNRNMGFGTSFMTQDSNSFAKADGGGSFDHRNDSLLDDMKSDSGFGSNGYSLDDLVNSAIKPEHDDFNFLDGDMGCSDIFSLGACM